jgi:small basic protein (TIGR04137 family)
VNPDFAGAIHVTIDKSLRVRRGATRNRSVLTRVERIARLREADRWKEGDSPLGLPKVRVRKLTMKKKKKKKEEEEGAVPAEGGVAPAAAAAAAAPAGAKPAAGKPAAGKPAGGKPAGGKAGGK